MGLTNFELLREELGYWQTYYNWQHPHGALQGKTPSQIDSALLDKTPLQEEVCAMYDESKEHIQEANYYP